MPSHRVLLDFEVDPSVLRRDRSFDPRSADVSLLRHSYFDMPVHFRIGGVTLIDGATIPIYTIAADGLEELERLPSGRRATMELPIVDGFDLEMDGDEVVITRRGGPSARVSYGELLKAWQTFADKVRNLLVSEFPELARHPQVGDWFSGEHLSDD